MFVMHEVSLPMYVKLAHICVVQGVVLPGCGSGLCGLIEKELCRILWIMFSSC